MRALPPSVPPRLADGVPGALAGGMGPPARPRLRAALRSGPIRVAISTARLVSLVRPPYTHPARSPRGLAARARVAQLVEQRIENPRVGGSNPPPGTSAPRGMLPKTPRGPGLRRPRLVIAGLLEGRVPRRGVRPRPASGKRPDPRAGGRRAGDHARASGVPSLPNALLRARGVPGCDHRGERRSWLEGVGQGVGREVAREVARSAGGSRSRRAVDGRSTPDGGARAARVRRSGRAWSGRAPVSFGCNTGPQTAVHGSSRRRDDHCRFARSR